jgi:hypothetical protein
VGIFLPFFQRPKKKPAIDTDAGFPVFSRPQLSGLDFEAMMHGKPRCVYVHCTISGRKKTCRIYSRQVRIHSLGTEETDASYRTVEVLKVSELLNSV